jgi:hypothetical protein
MTDGHCATDLETIYVGPVGSCSDTTGTGSASAPVCSAQAGVTIARTGSTKSVVLIRGTLTPPSLGVTTTIAISSPLTIVGKNNAVIVPASGADAITITSGEIYLRNLTIQGTASPKTGIGINAAPTSGNAVTLHMDTCAVTNNPAGGILLNGAAFDIRNTTVTGNGANSAGWGGIYVQSLPASGPTTINLVSILNNQSLGLTCTGSIVSTDTGSGVLATGNAGGDVISSCGISAKTCTAASTTCGAQSTPQ